MKNKTQVCYILQFDCYVAVVDITPFRFSAYTETWLPAMYSSRRTLYLKLLTLVSRGISRTTTITRRSQTGGCQSSGWHPRRCLTGSTRRKATCKWGDTPILAATNSCSCHHRFMPIENHAISTVSRHLTKNVGYQLQVVVRSAAVGDLHVRGQPIPVSASGEIIRTSSGRTSNGTPTLQLFRNVSVPVKYPSLWLWASGNWELLKRDLWRT